MRKSIIFHRQDSAVVQVESLISCYFSPFISVPAHKSVHLVVVPNVCHQLYMHVSTRLYIVAIPETRQLL